MIKFLMPFYDDIENEVFESKRAPKGISREAMIGRIASHFPTKNIVIGENARSLLELLSRHQVAKAGRPLSTAIGTMMCGSVYNAVKAAGPVSLMDCDAHWHQIVDEKARQADILLFAGLCGKRMPMPDRGHAGQILIDDSAQCFDKVSGYSETSDYSLFSFGAGKQAFAGGGGILWSGKHDLAPVAASVSYKMPDWQLFLLVSQIEKIETINKNRRANALYLIEKLKDISWLSLPDPENNSFLKFTVRINTGVPARAEERCGDHGPFTLHMARRGIEVEDWYMPLHLRFPVELPNPRYGRFKANELWHQAITLPCHPLLSQAGLDAVVEGVRSYAPLNPVHQRQRSEKEKWSENYTAKMLSRPDSDDYFSRLYDVKYDLVRKYGAGKKILDVGCGVGSFALPLLREGFDVTGLDFAENHLESLRQQWLSEGGDPRRLRTIAADVMDIREPDESYDVAFSFSTLCYIPDIFAGVAGIARVLRKGGIAILEFGNRRSLADVEAKRVKTCVRSRHVTPGVMRDALKKAGLAVRELKAFQLAPYYGGSTPNDIALNALLGSIMAKKLPDGRLCDEAVCSSPMLSEFAFRHLFVVQKGGEDAKTGAFLERQSEINQAQNLIMQAGSHAGAGDRDKAVKMLVRAIQTDPQALMAPFILASFFEGGGERNFACRMKRLLDRWMRIQKVPTESMAMPHPHGYNEPSLPSKPPMDERYALMLQRVNNAKTVVDLGCGGNLMPYATCAVDAYIDPVERGSGSINVKQLEARGIRFVQHAIDEPMPFKDHEFDFAYSAHVFEHLEDPATACEEMMRIAKAGFILTPAYVFDVLSGRTYHRWMLLERGRTLFFFEKEPHEDRPFGSWPNVIDAILNDGDWYKDDLGKPGKTIQSVLRHAYFSHHPFTEVCFNWEGRFDYMVVRCDGSIQTSKTLTPFQAKKPS